MAAVVATEPFNVWEAHRLEQIILAEASPELQRKATQFLSHLDAFLASPKVMTHPHQVLSSKGLFSGTVIQAVTDLKVFWGRLTYRLTMAEKELIEALLATRQVHFTHPESTQHRRARTLMHTPRGCVPLD